jgi:hypothetical protein
VRAALALVLLIAAGCEKEGSEESGSGASWPGATAAEVTRALEAVPEGAIAVAVLSMPKPFWSYLLDYTMVPMSGGERSELDKDLRAVLGGQLGLDVTRARGAVGFMALPASAAAVFRDVSGALKGASADGLAPLEDQVVAGHRGTTMALGLEPAVRAALDVGGGKVKNLTRADPKLAAWFAEQGAGSWIFLGATPKAAPDAPHPISKIDRLAISLGPKKLRAVAEGDPAALKQIATQIEALIAQSMTEMSALRAQAIKGELPVPIAAIGVYQYHQLKSMATHAKPVLRGNSLVIEVPIDVADSGMVTVALIGMGAAVAIPAFMKYMRTSKSVEPPADPLE